MSVPENKTAEGRPAPSPLPRAVLAGVLLFASWTGSLPVDAAAQHEIDPESWIEMRRLLREKGPAPSVEEDVAALAGTDARKAAPRLVDRGPEALPAVHAALLAPEVAPKHALALLQVIGFISEKSSVPVLLEWLRRDPKSPLRRDALYVLAILPATEDAAAFVGNLAADGNEPWRTRRMAFSWFGLHRDARGRTFAESLREDPDPERRAAALYVLARLGDKTALEPVSRLLSEGAPANSRDILLLALAELSAPGEFERRAPSALSWSDGYRGALRYARYRTASETERPAVCAEMLRSRLPGHLELAVRCLLDLGQARVLRPYAAVDLEAPGRAALVRNEIRRAGWRVIDTDTEFRIEPSTRGVQRNP